VLILWWLSDDDHVSVLMLDKDFAGQWIEEWSIF